MEEAQLKTRARASHVRKGATRRRRCLALGYLLVVSASGCARTYVPSTPKIARFPETNAQIESLHVGAFVSSEVRVRIAARPGMRLWDARFAVAHEPPCAAGAAFVELDMDGVPIPEGPLDLSGEHTLVFRFGGVSDTSRRSYDEWLASASEPAFLDLRLDGPDARRVCARIPLLGGPEAPTFRLADDSAGLFISMGGHAFPAGFGSGSETKPTGDFFVRLGAAFGPFRVRTDIGVVFTDVEASRHLLLGAGGDGAFYMTGPWSFRAGLGYDVAFNLYRPDPTQAGYSRYTLHGPRATLGVGYALIRNAVMPTFATHRALPAGQRTLSLELEAPMSLWFGTGDAPPTTFAPGVGLAVFWSF